MATGVITTSGITALLNAQIAGTAFAPNIVKISSDVLACTGDETSLPDIVWTAPSSAVSQLALSSSMMRTIVTMDTTVGNFNIGTLGLFTSNGLLFALGTFPGAGMKIANSLPEQVGNYRILYLDTSYADISNTFTPEISTVSSITLAEMVANLSGLVTARQLRTALNDMGLLGAVMTAIAGLAVTNPVQIDWNTCAAVGSGSTLIEYIADITGQTDSGAAILAAALLLPA